MPPSAAPVLDGPLQQELRRFVALEYQFINQSINQSINFQSINRWRGQGRDRTKSRGGSAVKGKKQVERACVPAAWFCRVTLGGVTGRAGSRQGVLPKLTLG